MPRAELTPQQLIEVRELLVEPLTLAVGQSVAGEISRLRKEVRQIEQRIDGAEKRLDRMARVRAAAAAAVAALLAAALKIGGMIGNRR